MPLVSAAEPQGLGVDSKGEMVVLAHYRWGTTTIETGVVTSSLYLAKIATDGAVLFEQHVDFDEGSVNPGGLAVMEDGTFYIAGSLRQGFARESPFLERYDSAGNRLWSNTYSAGRMAYAAAVAAAPNGDAVMTGNFDEWVDVG